MLRQQGNLAVFSSPEACLEACRAGKLHLDAVSICVPTSAHYSVAAQALAQGLDVLLEKPIAVTLADADALVGQAAASRRILQVGLLERFNPAVAAAEPLVNGPMFFEAHRLSVFHRRALDVDVVLDLMIHDLDIVLSFVRSPGKPAACRGPEDFVAQGRHRQRSPGICFRLCRQLHRQPGEHGNGAQAALLPAPPVPVHRLRPSGSAHHQRGSGRERGANSLAASKPPVQGGEPLLLEIQSFLDSVRTRTPPRVTPQQARDALALALEINQAIQAHAVRAGLSLALGTIASSAPCSPRAPFVQTGCRAAADSRSPFSTVSVMRYSSSGRLMVMVPGNWVPLKS